MASLDDYRLHDNRHTGASHLVSRGLSLAIVGRLFGHTNPLTSKRYADLADDPLRADAERFGSKIMALRYTRKAEVVPIGVKDASDWSALRSVEPQTEPPTVDVQEVDRE